jgi:hypothetical protein
MNNGKKSEKLLIVATVLTIVALASVLVVFATVIGTFHGNSVTVTDLAQGTIKYSSTGTSGWGTDMSAFNATVGSWYARFDVISTTYTGSSTVTFQLEKQNTDSSWSAAGSPVIISGFDLTGTSNIYASSDGTSSGTMHDFGGDISASGTYRITVTVASG